MIRLLLSVVTTAIALFLVTRVVPGVDVTPPDDPWAFIWVAVLFMVVNAVVSPIAHALGTPLKILTLGLFSLVINALLFMFTGWLSGQIGLGLTVDGFMAGLLGAVVMGVATWVLGLVTGAVTRRR
ncbi:MAG: phage holin family protein [Corynebacterium humireducens]|jgi:putative membrane protein|uniref:Phage holin family protein n=1 Tax=Corynebacterium humireducens TaxID=1223514 RepID=A0A7X6PNW3_9CORY|nr:phage holin family protein [Corynebacterium humireducens]